MSTILSAARWGWYPVLVGSVLVQSYSKRGLNYAPRTKEASLPRSAAAVEIQQPTEAAASSWTILYLSLVNVCDALKRRGRRLARCGVRPATGCWESDYMETHSCVCTYEDKQSEGLPNYLRPQSELRKITS